jgi:hypothetical protein
MSNVIIVSLLVMGIAHTISRERIFAPLRTRLGPDTWLGYLFSCPYCVSHWVAFVLVPVTGVYAVDVPHDWGILTPVARWFLSSILITVVAAFFRIGFYFIDESQGFLRRRDRQRTEGGSSSRPNRPGLHRARAVRAQRGVILRNLLGRVEASRVTTNSRRTRSFG